MEDVQALKELMEAGFDALKEQRAEDRSLQAQQHAENRQTLQRIETEVRRTNGRVTRTEEQIRSLFKRPGKESDDAKSVSRVDLRYIIGAFAAGVAALAWLLHVVGKI